MAFIGNSSSIQQYAPTISYFNGNGSTTVFTLPISVASAAQILVHVENVPQNPATAFTVSGSTLTFTSAPPTGTNNIWVEYTSLQNNSIAPSQGTVQNSSFGSITSIPFVNGGPIGGGNSSLMKNRIINGAMVIDQRNAGASGTSTGYMVDRFSYSASQASKLTWGQNLNSITPPAGFKNYLGFQSSSAYSITSTDYFELLQSIEGLNIYDLAWGTSSAKPVTLSFWVYSSLTGTFGGAITNSGTSRSYPFSYSISVANTWTQISVTISGDTTGTWLTTNGIGLTLRLSLGMGSTYSNTAGSWYSGDYESVTGAVSVVGTSGATFYITGVQLEVGTSATGYEYRQYTNEFSLCQRYYQKGDWTYNYAQWASVPFMVQMRATPTVTRVDNGPITGGTGTNGSVISSVISPYNFYFTATATGWIGGSYTASAEL
jgi:hypothetical protein